MYSSLSSAGMARYFRHASAFFRPVLATSRLAPHGHARRSSILAPLFLIHENERAEPLLQFSSLRLSSIIRHSLQWEWLGTPVTHRRPSSARASSSSATSRLAPREHAQSALSNRYFSTRRRFRLIEYSPLSSARVARYFRHASAVLRPVRATSRLAP